jgi:hypothetical protein
MPSILSRNRAGSEPRNTRPGQDRGFPVQTTRDHPFRDGPETFDPHGTHPSYVPQELAPQAVGASIEDGVAGPQHSALGLEGMEAEHASKHTNAIGRGRSKSHGQSSFGMNIKAPTVRYSRRSWYA